MKDKYNYEKIYATIKTHVDEYMAQILIKSDRSGYRVDLAIVDTHLIHFNNDYLKAPVGVVRSQDSDKLWEGNIAYSELNGLSSEEDWIYNASYMAEFVVIIQIKKKIEREYSDEVLFGFLIKGLLDWITHSFKNNVKNVITSKCLEFFQYLCNKYSRGKESEIMLESTATYINRLSSMLYESSRAKGRLLLCDGGRIANMELDIKFQDSVLLSNRSRARKMFEMSVEDYLLVTDGCMIYGLIHENKMPDAYIIQISGIYKWQFHKYEAAGKGSRFLMDVNEDFVSINRNDIDYATFREIYASVFPEVETVELQWEMFERAKKQEHGTMLLFSEGIDKEVKRLTDAGIAIEKTSDPKIIKAVTSIDGAVLMDRKGCIHAVGTILDGLISDQYQRDASRGARYNSAIIYTGTHEERCIAIVLSEDGYVNVVVNGKNLT